MKKGYEKQEVTTEQAMLREAGLFGIQGRILAVKLLIQYDGQTSAMLTSIRIYVSWSESLDRYWIPAGLLVASLTLAALLAARFQVLISGPILRLRKDS